MTTNCQLRRIAAWVIPLLVVGSAGPVAHGQANDLGAIVATSGPRQYLSGRWGVVGITASNRRTVDASLEVLGFFDVASDEQFSRQVWVPSGGIRRTWLPVRAPDIAPGGNAWNLEVLLNEVGADGQPTLRSGGGVQDLRADVRLLSSGHLKTATGVINDAHGAPGREDVEQVVEIARQSLRLEGAGVSLNDRLPGWAPALDALEVLVVASDRVADDLGTVAAIREWVSRGGRLWLLLDRVSDDTVQALFGERLGLVAVGREQLMDVALDVQGNATETRSLAESVELVLVAEHAGTTLVQCGDWPAAIAYEYGRGLVLVTTLGGRGWLNAPPPPAGNAGPDAETGAPGDARPSDAPANVGPTGAPGRGPNGGGGRRPRGAPRPAPPQPTSTPAGGALGVVSQRLFGLREAPAWPADLATALLNEEIGQRAPSRLVVGGVLVLFSVGLLVGGWWLDRHRRLESLRWLIPALAVVAAGVLLSVGAATRTAAPYSVGRLQIVDATTGAKDPAVVGWTVAYLPDTVKSPVEVAGGGVLGDLGAHDARRMRWTDEGRWSWPATDLPPGTHQWTSRGVAQLPTPIEAVARFGPDGVSGQLSGPWSSLEGGLLRLGFLPALAVRWDEQGRFAVGPEDVLATGQYSAETMLDRSTLARERFLAELLRAESSPLGAETVLLGWRPPLDDGFQWSAARETGAALVLAPVRLERTAPGQRVLIPGPLVPLRPRTAMFDGARGRWVERVTRAATMPLEFEVPATVRPLRIERALLELTIDAPRRPLEIRQGAQVLHSELAPLGVRRVVLIKGTAPVVDTDGVIRLELYVGEQLGAEGDAGSSVLADLPWTITQVWLQLEGTVEGTP